MGKPGRKKVLGAGVAQYSVMLDARQRGVLRVWAALAGPTVPESTALRTILELLEPAVTIAQARGDAQGLLERLAGLWAAERAPGEGPWEKADIDRLVAGGQKKVFEELQAGAGALVVPAELLDRIRSLGDFLAMDGQPLVSVLERIVGWAERARDAKQKKQAAGQPGQPGQPEQKKEAALEETQAPGNPQSVLRAAREHGAALARAREEARNRLQEGALTRVEDGTAWSAALGGGSLDPAVGLFYDSSGAPIAPEDQAKAPDGASA